MIIKTDEKGKQAIEQLCDAALKLGGVQAYNGVGEVLRSVELIKPDKKTGVNDGQRDSGKLHTGTGEQCGDG